MNPKRSVATKAKIGLQLCSKILQTPDLADSLLIPREFRFHPDPPPNNPKNTYNHQ